MVTIILTIAATGIIAALFGFVLAIASKVFHVKRDPRIDLITESLPGANCGGCGYPGCSGYAAAIVETGTEKTLCAPGGPDVCKCIAEIMGEEAEEVVPKYAVAQCQGTAAKAPERVFYDGVLDCRAAHILQGGPKTCLWGCLGIGTCVEACAFDAIRLGPDRIPVVAKDLCTGCGACVRACPRGIMQLIPVTAKYYIGCSSHHKAAAVKKACSVGCISCKRCEKKGPAEGAIVLEDNIPVLDYTKALEWPEANEVCPQNCFVIIDPAPSMAGASKEEKECES